MTKDILIFPFNGNAIEAIDCLPPNVRLIGFVDDDTVKRVSGGQYPVFSRDAFAKYPDAMVLAVPGSPASYLDRDRIISGLGLDERRFCRIIHSAAVISPGAIIGNNVLIMAGVVVANHAGVGSHVCILPNSVIHHHSVVGDYTLIGSNVTVAGRTAIGTKCYIGGGSSIINDVQIGDGALVGMGSNVIGTIPPGVKVGGNPARRIGNA